VVAEPPKVRATCSNLPTKRMSDHLRPHSYSPGLPRSRHFYTCALRRSRLESRDSALQRATRSIPQVRKRSLGTPCSNGLAALVAIGAGAVLMDRYHPSIEHPVNLSLVDQHRSAPGAKPATKPAVNDDSVTRRDELNRPSAEIAEGILPSLEQRQHGVDTYVGAGLSCHVALDPRVEGGFHGRAIAALPIAHKISHYGHVLLHRGGTLPPSV
jgi:hypothetical protein